LVEANLYRFGGVRFHSLAHESGFNVERCMEQCKRHNDRIAPMVLSIRHWGFCPCVCDGEKMKLPFYSKPGFYDKHRCRVSNSCEKCGKEFAEGEKIWSRFLSIGNRELRIRGYFRTVGYWCDECHEALYFVARRKR